MIYLVFSYKSRGGSRPDTVSTQQLGYSQWHSVLNSWTGSNQIVAAPSSPSRASTTTFSIGQTRTHSPINPLKLIFLLTTTILRNRYAYYSIPVIVEILKTDTVYIAASQQATEAQNRSDEVKLNSNTQWL